MPENIYILGGGLSGIYAKLQNKDSKLIDKNDNITISTRLINVLGGSDISYAYRKRYLDYLENVEDIDFANRLIFTDKGKHSYDKVIIALGHSQRTDSIKGSEYIHKLETIEDAQDILRLLQRASKIAIIGGSYLGVELATLITGKNVTVIDSHAHLFGNLSYKISSYISSALEARGVKLITNTRVIEAKKDGIVTDNNFINADLILYAGGLSGNALMKNIKIRTKNSRIIVNQKLRSVDYDDVYACGDSMEIEGHNFPVTAFTARKSGEIAMKNATGSDIDYKYYSSGNILNLGGKFVMIKNGKIKTGLMINVIKKYVNGKTEKSLSMLEK